jgi:hypothetical protein
VKSRESGGDLGVIMVEFGESGWNGEVGEVGAIFVVMFVRYDVSGVEKECATCQRVYIYRC